MTDVVERCRVWWLLASVPQARADDMAAELEAHLRERPADGGRVEDVVGDDLGRFAADWAASARVGDPRRYQTGWRVLARLSGLFITAALYAAVVLVVDAAVAHREGVIRASDLLWFGVLVAAQETFGGGAVARRVVIAGARGLALLVAAVVMTGPLVVPLVSRLLGQLGPVVFTLGWPQALLLALAAALVTGASVLVPRQRWGEQH